jgi:hypothetical protein
MNDACGRCGTPAAPEAVTCDACGALLAAYRPPTGAREAMPEPDFDPPKPVPSAPVDPIPVVSPQSTPIHVTLETNQPPVEQVSLPEPTPQVDVDPSDREADFRLDEASVVTERPAAVPAARERDRRAAEPAPVVVRPMRQVAPPAEPLITSNPRRHEPAASPLPMYLVGSIAGILVACLLVAIGSSDRASDAYAYVGLCLGPLSLIGLLIAAGLAAISRMNTRN